MAFPVAHSLFGATLSLLLIPCTSKKQCLKTVAIGGFLGVLPDFDYLLNWIQIFGSGWHHGFSHSIIFALIVGTISAWLFRDFSFRTILAFSLAIVSHTLLDYLITESRGVALFSPFTDFRYKLEFPNPIDYQWTSESLQGMLLNILRICAVEFAIFVPLFLVVKWLNNKIYKLEKT